MDIDDKTKIDNLREEQRRKRQQRREHRKSKGKRGLRWDRIIPLFLILIVFFSLIGFGLFKLVTAFSNSTVLWSTQESTTTETNMRKTNISTVPFDQASLDKPLYVLVLGKDANSPAEADAIFLLAVNKEQKTLDVIAIPSNTKIDSRNKKTAQKLSTIYTEGGMELTKAVVEDMFHIVIPYFIEVDKAGFEKLIDIVGTPSLYVEKNMYYEDMVVPADSINLAQGYQTLDADKAFQYVRYLDTNKDAFARTQRQERFLKTILTQQEDSFTAVRAFRLWRLWSALDTNISTWDAISTVFKMRRIDSTNLQYFILPGAKTVMGDTIYWSSDPVEAQHLVGITTGNIDRNDNAQLIPSYSSNPGEGVTRRNQNKTDGATPSTKPIEPGQTVDKVSTNKTSKE